MFFLKTRDMRNPSRLVLHDWEGHSLRQKCDFSPKNARSLKCCCNRIFSSGWVSFVKAMTSGDLGHHFGHHWTQTLLMDHHQKKIKKIIILGAIFFLGGGVIFFGQPKASFTIQCSICFVLPSFKHSIFSNLHIRLLDWALPRRQLATYCRIPLIKIIKTYKMGHWGSQTWARDHRGHVRAHWHTANYSELVSSNRAQKRQNFTRTLYTV